MTHCLRRCTPIDCLPRTSSWAELDRSYAATGVFNFDLTKIKRSVNLSAVRRPRRERLRSRKPLEPTKKRSRAWWFPPRRVVAFWGAPWARSLGSRRPPDFRPGLRLVPSPELSFPRRRHLHRSHPCGSCGLDSHVCVFKNQAGFGCDAKPFRGQQKRFRIRFSFLIVTRANQGVETLQKV